MSAKYHSAHDASSPTRSSLLGAWDASRMKSLKSLSDKELIGRLRQLIRKERALTLEILPHPACVGHAIISCVSESRS